MQGLLVDLVVFGGIGYLIGDITGMVIGAIIGAISYQMINS